MVDAVTGEMLWNAPVIAQTLEVIRHTSVLSTVEFIRSILTVAVAITTPVVMDTLSAARALKLIVVMTTVARGNVTRVLE